MTAKLSEALTELEAIVRAETGCQRAQVVCVFMADGSGYIEKWTDVDDAGYTQQIVFSFDTADDLAVYLSAPPEVRREMELHQFEEDAA